MAISLRLKVGLLLLVNGQWPWFNKPDRRLFNKCEQLDMLTCETFEVIADQRGFSYEA